MIERQVFDLVVAVNPVGQGRILHHLRLRRYARAREVCSAARRRAFLAWRRSREAWAHENYRRIARLWQTLWHLEREMTAR